MEDKELGRRTCKRFEIPGATVNFAAIKSPSSKEKYEEEFCPILNLSRGGLKFVGNKPIEIGSDIILKISLPGEQVPLTFNGKVKWLSAIKGQDKYQIGVQFNPYGEKEEQNYPGNLVKVIALEQKFLTPDKAETEKYEIDG
ncbi:MAG: PilZ domain-containing protein [Candidatus Aminicenantes bacterium]|nr:MAG: PilZ domain-containing protein [Candidatus Aminicenantes bacterium]